MTARSVLDPFWDLATSSAAEAAAALGIPLEAVYDGVARGSIPAERWGRRIVVRVQDLARQLGVER